MLPKWATDYVGISYKDKGRTRDGIDCYGLVRLVYRDIFNIDLPSMRSSYETAREASQTIKENGILNDRWVEIPTPMTGAVIVLRIMGKPKHVGVVLDNKYMLHSMLGHNSAIETFANMKWTNKIIGYYVYV